MTENNDKIGNSLKTSQSDDNDPNWQYIHNKDKYPVFVGF